MARKWTNNGFSTLSDSSLSPTATSLTVFVGQGDRFPAVSAPDFFFVTLQDSASNIEIVKVTERNIGSDTFTIVRAQEGTTARPWTQGDIVELRLTAGALEELAEQTTPGYFAKSDRDTVAWEKTGNNTAKVGQTIFVEVGGSILEIAADTAINMPTLTVGTDYAIWIAPNGTVEADESFTVAPTAGGRRVGGFHYAPGGRATLDLDAGDGGTTPQIMETSFYDLKWRPSVVDPRGLVLVGDGAFWAGMYHMSANHLTGPVHKFGVDPCRDGNPPQNLNGVGNFPDAQFSNTIEALNFHGFRAPNYWEFQLLAFGAAEERGIGGTDPGNTGDVLDRGKDQQTSAWGVFDATGVLQTAGNDTLLREPEGSPPFESEPLPNPPRGSTYRYASFATFSGSYLNTTSAGSRFVSVSTAAISFSFQGSRGVCDHLIID